jgi:hypothetical protein
MTTNRQDQWIENLSAYLDGELSIPERRKLEIMLQENATLRQHLNALEKTRTLLRNAPRLKVPHNFTLTAAMLPQKQPGTFWLPLMSSSSILAAVALIFTFVFNLTSFASPKMIQNYALDAAPMVESMAASAQVAPQDAISEKSTAPTEPPMIIQWFGNVANGKGGGGGGPATDILAEAAPAVAAEAPAMAVEESTLTLAEPLPDAAVTEVGTTSDMQTFAAEAPAAMPTEQPILTLSEGIPQATAALLSTEQPSLLPPEATPLEATSDGLIFTTPTAAALPVERQLNTETPLQNPILGIAPAEEQGKIISEPTESMPVPVLPIEPKNQGTSTDVLILRGALLLVSLLSGAFAMILRRRQNL